MYKLGLADERQELRKTIHIENTISGADRLEITVKNLTGSPIFIRKEDIIAKATPMQNEVLPSLHPDGFMESSYHSVASDKDGNAISPRDAQRIEFAKEVEKYRDRPEM